MQILSAALKCFTRSGFSGSPMEEIAREAGVSKGLLHYHFKSKEQLLIEVQSHLFRRVSETIRAATARLGPSVEQAKWALDELWRNLTAAQPMIPMMADLALRSRTRRSLRARFLRSIEEQRQLLIDGVRTVLGPLEKRLPLGAERFSDALLSALAGLCVNAAFTGDPARVEAAYRDLREIFIEYVTLHMTPPPPLNSQTSNSKSQAGGGITGEVIT